VVSGCELLLELPLGTGPDAISSLPPAPRLKAAQARKRPQVEQVDIDGKRSWNEVAPVLLKSTEVRMEAGRGWLRKRERGASKRSWRRAGRGKQEQRAGKASHQIDRLRERALCEGEALCCDEFSMQRDGLASSTGWQGCTPPKKMQSQLKCLYQTGEIHNILWLFYPVPYPMPPQ
jgi:hypothetical protein